LKLANFKKLMTILNFPDFGSTRAQISAQSKCLQLYINFIFISILINLS